MKFREYDLPVDANYASLDEIPDDTKQLLDIYEAINNRSAVYRAERANILLDGFIDQQCYIAEEDDLDEEEVEILAVANYRREMQEGFAWVEGLAVHHEQRRAGIGRYVLDNLVEITRESGLSEIRLRSVPGAVSFYQRNGFVVMEGDEVELHPHMSREI